MPEEEVVNYLKKIKPGKLPAEIFYQFCRLFYTIACDLVIFDSHDHILLTKRENNDPFWPGMLHVPGKVTVGTDKNYLETAKRVLSSELPGIKTSQPVLAGSYSFDGMRGPGETKVFIARLIKNNNYKFYDPKDLPKDATNISGKTIDVAMSNISLLP